MRISSPTYPHSDLTKKVIGAAMLVHSELKSGLIEKIYENSLCVELAHQEIYFSQQKIYPVHYRGKFVGKLIPDLVVEDKLVVDTKCVESITSDHVAQILSYLAITGLEVGLLVNFRNKSLEFKRVAKIDNFGAETPDK